MNNSLVIGADIGGSHISVALVDLKSGSIVPHSSERGHVNAHGTANEIFKAWAAVISKVLSTSKTSITKIGLAMPNPVDYESGVSYIKDIDKYDALYGLNIKELLSRELGLLSSDIKMKNDAGCFLQGESFGGAAKGYNDVIGLTIGTGIGTARYHNGVAEDADLWHSPFKDSIVEDYISSRWFVKRYAERSGKTVKNVKELASLYVSDKHAQDVFTEFSENLSEFLISFIEMDKPELIVIGGNIANASSLFFPNVEKHLSAHAIHIPIHKAILGEEAAIIGAASCWYERKHTSLNSIIL
ncbi:MAG TPA: ROK family protein [Cyclobacteriaceae bacterium]